MTIISSERLDLIPLEPAFLAASLVGNAAAAERNLGLKVPSEWFEERDVMAHFLSQLQSDPSLQPWLMRAMGWREGKVMVGHIGFHTRPGPGYLREIAPGGVEFGYTVFTPFRRQGYAREACAALMRWAYQEHQVTRFVLSIGPDNVPSLRLAQRFGFVQIGSHIDEEDGLEHIYELIYPAGLPESMKGPQL